MSAVADAPRFVGHEYHAACPRCREVCVSWTDAVAFLAKLSLRCRCGQELTVDQHDLVHVERRRGLRDARRRGDRVTR